MKKVLMFTASWCGPCQRTKPVFLALKEQVSDVQMELVDVDDKSDLANQYGIRSVPTFVLLKEEQEVARMSGGSNQDKLKAFINQ